MPEVLQKHRWDCPEPAASALVRGQIPIYTYKAIANMQSPIANTDVLVAKDYAVGANIPYQHSTVGGHAADATNGHTAAKTWLDRVLDGMYAF